jgi:hypothetical protein
MFSGIGVFYRKCRSAEKKPVQMVIERKDNAVAASHRFEKARTVQQAGISDRYARFVDINQPVI